MFPASNQDEGGISEILRSSCRFLVYHSSSDSSFFIFTKRRLKTCSQYIATVCRSGRFLIFLPALPVSQSFVLEEVISD